MAKIYQIHSTVRSRHNRTQRAAAPMHHRMKQHVGANQVRLVRSRPVQITEEALLRDLVELRKKHAMGILEVRTMDGRKFDLYSMDAAPGEVVAPLPNPPLDSAANDVPAGQPMANLPGGKPIESLPDVTPDEEDEEEDMTGEEPIIPEEFMGEPVAEIQKDRKKGRK